MRKSFSIIYGTTSSLEEGNTVRNFLDTRYVLHYLSMWSMTSNTGMKCSKAYFESQQRARLSSCQDDAQDSERRPLNYPTCSQMTVILLLFMVGSFLFAGGVYLAIYTLHPFTTLIPLFLFSILLLLPSTYALTVFIGSYYNIQGWNYDDVPRYFD